MTAIHIERLRLHLPAGMQAQARDFAQRLAAALSETSLAQSARIDALRLGPIAQGPGIDAAAAAAIAKLREAIEHA